MGSVLLRMIDRNPMTRLSLFEVYQTLETFSSQFDFESIRKANTTT